MRKVLGLALVVVVAFALAQGLCGCPDREACVTSLTTDAASVSARRQAITCLVKGERKEAKWPCPLDDQISWRSWASLRPIASALADDDAEVRRRGVEAFGLLMACNAPRRLDRQAEAAFLHALELPDPDQAVHMNAIIGLGITGTPSRVVPALRAVLATEHQDSGARRAAAEVLCWIGDGSAAPDLAAILGKWDTPLQLSALERLGKIGPDAASALPAVTAVLRNGPLALQAAAAQAAAQVCAENDEACASLAAEAIVASFGRVQGRTPPWPQNQYTMPGVASRALSRLGRAALPPLAVALRDASPSVRALAINGIAGFQRFSDLSTEGRYRRRSQCATAQLYSHATPELVLIVGMLRDADRKVRGEATSALLSMAPFLIAFPTVAVRLDRAVADADPEVRRVAKMVRTATPITFWTAEIKGEPVGRPASTNWSLPDSQSNGWVKLPGALASGLSDPGSTELRATVTPTGAVRSIRVLGSRKSVFAEACVSALRGWRYRPGSVNDRAASFEFKYSCRSSPF